LEKLFLAYTVLARASESPQYISNTHCFVIFYEALKIIMSCSNFKHLGGPTALALVVFYIVSECSHGGDPHHSVRYGVDTSFPMQNHKVSTNYPWLHHNLVSQNNTTPEKYRNMKLQPLGNRQQFFEDFMTGCREYHNNRSSCDEEEEKRIGMNMVQPRSVKNYTKTGFQKIRAPEALYQRVREFWEQNKDKEEPELWFEGSIFTNFWESPSYVVSTEDSNLPGSENLSEEIWNATKGLIEDWTGQNLRPSSLYGVRIYKEGAVLSPHVDRLPLVSSGILNVAQDVDEDWPLEVIGHDGIAHNITMQPGDLVLYESHSILHGRPFPLKGRFFANVFIHFEPIGDHSEINIDSEVGSQRDASYILEDTKDNLMEYYDDTHQTNSGISVEAHSAAYYGDVERLSSIAEEDREQLYQEDENGWQPIHEGARSGSIDVVEMLINHDVDINSLTREGGSPLYYAVNLHGHEHPMVSLLERQGAFFSGPEF